jgi:hypothetical protein
MIMAAEMNSRERKCALYLQHPDECPELIGALPYLIHPPSKLSATARWVAFRDKTLLPLLAAEPDDPNLPNFLKKAEAILAWRSTVPEEDRLWRADTNS